MQRRMAFQFVMFTCGFFVPLTLLAMWFYPGSTVSDPTTQGYLFTRNFFSDLGLTRTYGGEPNLISALMFFAALGSAGLALVVFFGLAAVHFSDGKAKWFGRLGSFAGVLSGLSFVGVAFTPANLYLDWHIQFVYWAFEAFLVAALFCAAAIFFQPGYPRRYAWLYLLFAVCLAGYLWLLFEGPAYETPAGNLIQAVGQKIIVYIAIVSMALQGYGAWWYEKRRSG